MILIFVLLISVFSIWCNDILFKRNSIVSYVWEAAVLGVSFIMQHRIHIVSKIIDVGGCLSIKIAKYYFVFLTTGEAGIVRSYSK